MWPGAADGGGVSGTAIPLTPGATGTIIGGPVTTGNGNIWWQISTGGQTGWTDPANLTMTGTAPPPTAIQLQWAPSPSAGLIGYNIYKGTATGQEAALPIGCAIAPCTAPTVPASITIFIDGDVSHGTTYFYTITAVGSPSMYSTAESVHSNETSVAFALRKGQKAHTK
jgi:hypothetical protein